MSSKTRKSRKARKRKRRSQGEAAPPLATTEEPLAAKVPPAAIMPASNIAATVPNRAKVGAPHRDPTMPSDSAATADPHPQEATEAKRPAQHGPLKVTVLPLSFEGLDSLGGQDLVAFVGVADRPLRGLAGWMDWRMCGSISRMVKDGVLTSESGEALLTLPSGRLPCERIFLFGLGSQRRPPLEEALQQVARAGSKRAAICPAGWDDPKAASLNARDAMLAARKAGIAELSLLAANPRAGEHAIVIECASFPWASFEPPAPG